MIVGRDNQDLCFAPYNVDTVDLGAGLATTFTASFDSPVNFWDKPIFLGGCVSNFDYNTIWGFQGFK